MNLAAFLVRHQRQRQRLGSLMPAARLAHEGQSRDDSRRVRGLSGKMPPPGLRGVLVGQRQQADGGVAVGNRANDTGFAVKVGNARGGSEVGAGQSFQPRAVLMIQL